MSEQPTSKKRVATPASRARAYTAARMRAMPSHRGTLRERELYAQGLQDGFEAGFKSGIRRNTHEVKLEQFLDRDGPNS